MTTPLTVPFLLPADLLVIPVADLSEHSRSMLGAADGDFAITRPRTRTPTSVVDADSADLLQRFRSARTIIDAVVEFSRERSADPRTVLDGAFPVLHRLIGARMLVPANGEYAAPVVASLTAGDRVDDLEIIRKLSVLFDVELYQARLPNGALCLLKLARAEGGERIVRSLAHESEILARLAGPSVPRLLRAGSRDELPYIVVEWREGTPPLRAAAELRDLEPPASRAALRSLCVEIVAAYDAVHVRGLAHGDVHDLNMLVDRAGHVTLVDFGQAYDLSSIATSSSSRGGVFRNHDPEIAAALLAGRRGPPATAASEQYAIATMLYEIVTGLPYIDLAIRREVALRQIVHDQPLSFAARGVEAWPAMESILLRMLAKDPADRFPSMADVRGALLAAHAEAPAAPRAAVAVGSHARMARALFDRLSVGGSLFRNGLPAGPHCSVNNGAAGIAHAWYRLALFREDAESLAAATAWARRGVSWLNSDEAFFLRDKTFTPQTVGRAGLFHSAAGLHCVRGLIANANANQGELTRAVSDFAASSKSRSDKWDLTLGRAGVLLGSTLLFESARQPHAAVRKYGDRLSSALTRELAAAGSVTTSQRITALGIAHGWAGGLYALLRWASATHRAPAAWVMEQLEELASCAQISGRGAVWPRFRAQTDPSLEGTWCNGGTGLVFLWLLAAESCADDRFIRLAEDAGWSVADRPFDRAVDLCCGSAGRAYAFLALYRRTGDSVWLNRAKRFAAHAVSESDPDAPTAHRLYKGALGVALLINELEDPRRARMPLFEPEGWAWRHE
jgi:eukaryotic-like serine/threonine-protein kinase